MTVTFRENTSASKVDMFAERLITAAWFKEAGVRDTEAEKQLTQFLDQLDVRNYGIKWLTTEELTSVIQGQMTFAGSELWEKLKDLPEEWKEKITANQQEQQLEKIVDFLPEAVYHPAFAGAFQQVGEKKAVGHLTGVAMYLSVMACTALLSGEESLFEPIVSMIEAGHAPVGVEGDTVYLL